MAVENRGEGPEAAAIADALITLLRRSGWDVGTDSADGLILIAGSDVAEAIDRIATAAAPSIVIITDDRRPLLDRHLLRAAIEPLAIARAPLRHVSAVDYIAGADPADVTEAAVFLLSAPAITGQILMIAPRG